MYSANQLWGLSEVPRDNQVIEECILFGFTLNDDIMYVLNFCTLYAKYYIYVQ